jgi:hypothetical protein
MASGDRFGWEFRSCTSRAMVPMAGEAIGTATRN